MLGNRRWMLSGLIADCRDVAGEQVGRVDKTAYALYPGAGLVVVRSLGPLGIVDEVGRSESGQVRLEGRPYGLDVPRGLLAGQADPVVVQWCRETVERTAVRRGVGERAAELTQFKREQVRPGVKDLRPVVLADLVDQCGVRLEGHRL